MKKYIFLFAFLVGCGKINNVNVTNTEECLVTKDRGCTIVVCNDSTQKTCKDDDSSDDNSSDD